ncbi:hypothetical protein I314_04490 [Cryptococcus bacillisporus CA1873]|uniref:Uncharacterized protein n=1 Tax=Cryptococcus bacillisporus CA1873 TaxID=1296111 RepID=A0ABR5B7C9_CRYGA|nr:hypothetical protein I314_04490 [Cryptococcus bacillisporus CA1873]|eukprot:KIR59504.1 hypothetical protein I314_04490 [Cryptococcus gattii CA1873]
MGSPEKSRMYLPPKAMQKRRRPRRKASSRVKLCPSVLNGKILLHNKPRR